MASKHKTFLPSEAQLKKQLSISNQDETMSVKLVYAFDLRTMEETVKSISGL